MTKDKVVSTGNREIAILFTASFFTIGNQSAPPFNLLLSFVGGGLAHWEVQPPSQPTYHDMACKVLKGEH